MRQLESTRLQGANNPQRPPNNNILSILATNLRLKPVGHVGIRQTLDTFRERALKNDIEGVFVVACAQGFGLAFTRLPEPPGLFVERLLPPIFATTTS